jgi:hypothetical protein
MKRAHGAARLLAAAFLSATALVSAAAVADEPSPADKETARTLFRSGDERYRAGDYRGALEAFAAADAIMRVPTTGLELGRTQAKLGLLVEARETLRRAAQSPPSPDEPPAFPQARSEAAALYDDLGRRIPAVVLRVVGSGGARLETAEVRVDGDPVEEAMLGQPRRLNPGVHRLVVTAPGFAPAEGSVTLGEGEERELALVLEPLPVADEPSVPDAAPVAEGPVPTVAWVAFGVGGAALVAGTITGAVVLARAGELESDCPDKRCTPEDEDLLDSTVALSHASTALFVVAGVAGGLGLVAILLPRDEARAAAASSWQPLVGPGFAGVRAAF